jgi:hypothetical protein
MPDVHGTAVDATRRDGYDLPVLRPVLVGFLLLAVSCSRDDGPRTPSPLLSAADPSAEKVDVAAAAKDPEALRRLLNRPHRAAAQALGAHRFAGKSTMKVTENGAEVESLSIEESAERSAEGDFHTLLKNSRDYGREVFWSGGQLWLRPGFGKYHRRAPAADDEPARLLDEAVASLAADYDLVADGAALTDGGSTNLNGRAGRKIALSLAPKARAHRAEDLPQRAWRQEVSVLSLSGELIVDEATGVLLDGKLEATLRFVKQGHTYDMAITAQHAVSDVGGAITITPPAEADSVATPGRSSEVDEREDLLKGLAPPARRGPAAASETKSGETKK